MKLFSTKKKKLGTKNWQWFFLLYLISLSVIGAVMALLHLFVLVLTNH